jgi:hypothetical protein
MGIPCIRATASLQNSPARSSAKSGGTFFPLEIMQSLCRLQPRLIFGPSMRARTFTLKSRRYCSQGLACISISHRAVIGTMRAVFGALFISTVHINIPMRSRFTDSKAGPKAENLALIGFPFTRSKLLMSVFQRLRLFGILSGCGVT